MLNFSYLLSPTTIQELKRIDETRNKILIELVEPRLEIKLKHSNTIDLIERLLFLSGKSVSKREIAQVMSGDIRPVLSGEILEIKHSYDYFRQSWLLLQEPITADGLTKVMKILHLDRRVNENITHDI